MMNTLPPANVFIGAFGMPFFLMLVFWFVVLLIEYPIFYFLQRRKVSLLHTLWLVGLANVVSWLMGSFIFSLVPDYYGIKVGMGDYEPDRIFVIASFIGITIAFFLSWLIEYLFIRSFKRFFQFRHLGQTVGYINLVTYLAVYIACFWSIIVRASN